MRLVHSSENYTTHAEVSQDLKRVITHHVAGLDRRLDDDMQETLDSICWAIGKMLAGNPREPQQWHGISNIALYVAMRLDKAND